MQPPPPEPRLVSRSDARAERGQPEEEEVALMLEVSLDMLRIVHSIPLTIIRLAISHSSTDRLHSEKGPFGSGVDEG